MLSAMLGGIKAATPTSGKISLLGLMLSYQKTMI